MKTAKRLEGMRESFIREMTRVALTHNAINLSQGFPDYDAPPEVIEAAKAALGSGLNQYGITWGIPALRQAIAETMATRYGLSFDPDREITVTCGVTEAMSVIFMSLLDPGDEVIVIEPFHEGYLPQIKFAGGMPRLCAPGGAGLSAGRRAREGGHHSAHQGHHPEYSAQSHGPGVYPRGAGRCCGAMPGVRSRGHHRRDLRPHHLRRAEAHPHRDAAGHGGADDHRRGIRQDLRRNGLAAGLRVRAGAVDRGHTHRARLHDHLRAGAACRPRASRPWSCRSPTTRS